jgi:potassium channel subfamily K
MQQARMNAAAMQKRKQQGNLKSKLSFKEFRVRRQSTIDQIGLKKEFYGQAEINWLIEFWQEHSKFFWNFTIIFLYYLIGGCYFASPNVMVRFMGSENTSQAIALACMYYITVTMSSVGYGDYYPTTDQSRMFAIFYIFCGIGIIGRCLNDFAQVIIDFAETKAAERRNKTVSVEEMSKNARLGWDYINKLFSAFMTIFLTLLCGTIFMCLNEPLSLNYYAYASPVPTDWGSGITYSKNNGCTDWITYLYFCVVTSSTVGYGDIVPHLDSSKLFMIFYIITSTIIVAVGIGNIAQVVLEMKDEQKRLEMMQRKLDFNMIREMDKDGQGIDQTTFLVCMLEELGLVNAERDCAPWIKKFKELDSSGDGRLNVEDVIAKLEKGEEDRVNHLLEMLQSSEQTDKVADVLGNVMSFVQVEMHHLTDTMGITHRHSNIEDHHTGGEGDRGRTNTTLPVVQNPMQKGSGHV